MLQYIYVDNIHTHVYTYMYIFVHSMSSCLSKAPSASCLSAENSSDQVPLAYIMTPAAKATIAQLSWDGLPGHLWLIMYRYTYVLYIVYIIHCIFIQLESSLTGIFDWDAEPVNYQFTTGKATINSAIWIYKWGFPEIGLPPNGWFIMENPIKKWMMTRGTPMTQETPKSTKK